MSRRVRTLRFIVFPCVLVLCLRSETKAQGWSWPDNPENLKVLSDTTSPQMLSRVMRGFTAALGVRCQHCHVGEEGMPLAEFDFPADDKREKRVAREMLKMVRRVNVDVIANLEDGTGFEVNCFTCHRGQPIPPIQFDRLLTDLIAEEGVAGALMRYDELRDEFHGTGVYNFSARTFTRVANRLIDGGELSDAIAILERGVEEHPKNARIQFSLGRAHLAASDSTLARLYYERALMLQPDSRFIRRALNEIGR